MSKAVDQRPRAEAGPIAAMLAVHGEIARGGPLNEVLDAIAREAAGVVAARAASVILVRDANHYKLLGSFGLSAGYARMLSEAPLRLQHGQGPSGVAVESGRPVVISDTETDPGFRARRRLSRSEGYRGLVSTPLIANGVTLGTLNVYREHAAVWTTAETELLVFFAAAAASAIQTVQLIDRQSRQLAAMHRLVQALREQAHEHANRIHAIGGLLALDDPEEAGRFVVGIGSAHKDDAASIEQRIHQPTVAGLVLAEMTIGRQRGITLALTPESLLDGLPPMLDEGEVLTILGNLLQNAFEALGRMPKDQRHVELHVVGGVERGLELTVSDTGPGIAADLAETLFEPGVSAKPGHPGLGLALVLAAVDSAFGTVEIGPDPRGGTCVTVLIPGR